MRDARAAQILVKKPMLDRPNTKSAWQARAAALKPEGRAFIDGAYVAAAVRRDLRAHLADRRPRDRRIASGEPPTSTARSPPRGATFERGDWRDADAAQEEGAAALRRADPRRPRAARAARDTRRRQADPQLARTSTCRSAPTASSTTPSSPTSSTTRSPRPRAQRTRARAPRAARRHRRDRAVELSADHQPPGSSGRRCWPAIRWC